jgi:hypothetical protein
MINTFPSKRNIDFLSERGIKTITMPFSGSPRRVDYSHKDIDVIVSGQMDPKYYPIRTRIFDALKSSDVKFAYLPHSGLDSSHARHIYHGEKFHELLDRCWIGVTCRAGNFRDRIVPKYVEFGFSKVLPVGDCPTYMSQDMCESMIEVKENDDLVEIVSKIKDTLSDKNKLVERIEKYSVAVEKDYDYDVNVRRVLSMIDDGSRDS